ncbi:unnamed protein product, partial [Symbiodinium necroappetens]
MFRCWRHSVLYLRMHRRAQQQGKELRKQRRLTLLTEADQAIRQGQSRLFYQLVDKLAPKGRFRKFQMTKAGQILTAAEELEVMRKHFVQVFNPDHPAETSQVAITVADAPFQVECHELQAFLDKLPIRKAGAPATAPGAVWRACSDMVAPLLTDLLNRRWSQSPLSPPEPWAKALQDAGITGAPAELLLTWLHRCTYDLFVDGKCAHIPTTRGVKQGCPASPLLFAAFMTLITRRLSTRLSCEWVAQHLTMFADDFHVGKCFHSYHELETLSAQADYLGAVTTYGPSATVCGLSEEHHAQIQTLMMRNQMIHLCSPLNIPGTNRLREVLASQPQSVSHPELDASLAPPNVDPSPFSGARDMTEASPPQPSAVPLLPAQVLEKHITSWSCPAMPLPPTHTCAQVSSLGSPQGAELPDAASASTALLAPVLTASTPPPPGQLGQRTAVISASNLEDVRPRDPILRTEVEQSSGRIWERAMNILAEGGLSALLRHPINRELLHHCGVCDQWLATPTALKNHYRLQHTAVYDRVVSFTLSLHLMAMAAPPSPQATDEVLGQLQSCFGSVLANKRSMDDPMQAVPADRTQKTGRGAVALGGQGKGFQGKGARRRPGGRGRGENSRTFPHADSHSFSSGSTADNEDAELLHLLAKAVVRHEDSINILRRSTGWVFWARSGEGSILPLLSDLARKWSEAASKQEIQPGRVSLRVTLLWGLLTCLQEKVANLTQDQIAFAMQSSWIDTNGGWNFQKWDAHHQMLIVDTSRPPLSTAQVKESLGKLLQVINGDTLTRFSATQEIRADAQGKITFHADISLRAPGSDALYQELVRLQGSALFQIIGVQFKPEGSLTEYGSPDVRSSDMCAHLMAALVPLQFLLTYPGATAVFGYTPQLQKACRSSNTAFWQRYVIEASLPPQVYLLICRRGGVGTGASAGCAGPNARLEAGRTQMSVICVLQELWELELPSILGLAHPRFSADDAASDAGWEDFSIPEVEVEDSSSLRDGSGQRDSPQPASSGQLESPHGIEPTSTSIPSPKASSDVISSFVIDADAEASATQDLLATQVYAPTDPTSGVWSEVWNMDRPTLGFHTYELRLDGIVLPPEPEPDASSMELLAFS